MMKRKRPSASPTKADSAGRTAFAQRLKQAAENQDLGELAARIGVTPATLYRWFGAQFDPSLPKLVEFATATTTSVAWLVTGKGPPDARRAERHALLEDYESVDFRSANSTGSKAPLAFHEPWLFELLFGSTADPKLVSATTTLSPPLLLEVDEDSMEPTIAKGDLLLVDRSFGLSPNEPRQAQREARSPLDGVYAFQPRVGDSNAHLRVRRIQYRLDGTLVIRCDNPRYPEEAYRSNAPYAPRPFGRVVWRGGRI